MFECDEFCLIDVLVCLNILLLGLGVLVGIVYVIDCEVLVVDFGFICVICNLLDVVFDCDYVMELMLVVLIFMLYLLCLVEDMIFYIIGEVGFIELVDMVIFGFLLML